MEVIVGSTKLSIDLQNGVYALDADGAVGKTYLYKLLKAYAELQDSVIAITYDKKDNLDSIKGSKDKVIMLDRYDLYHTDKLSRELFKLGKQNIILLDIKEWNRLPICPGMADLELKEGEILVYA